ncbi:MAG: VWA domain-containing protein [Rudaea sp.]|nr:VWA domain-containing protein [Rudaea sp.]
MNAIIANFHFLRPWWLLALAALPLLWHMLVDRGGDAGAWRGAVDAHLLEHLLVPGDGAAPTRLPRWLVAAGWALACVSLAGPAWERLPQPLYQNRAARVFALELSTSMLAQDAKPSRYERAHYKLDDMLKRSGDAQTALIAYAGDAFVVAPLTDDTNTVANLVDALDPGVMPINGNATGRAIDLALKLIKQGGADDGEIVLLADSADDDAAAAARRALAAGVRVSVLGIGSEQGAPVALPQGGFLKNAAGDIVLPKLDAGALAAVAAAGGGRYVTYTADAADLDKLLDTLAPHAVAEARATQATTPRFLDRGPWLVLLLLPLAALGFRRGWLMLLPLALCAHTQTAQAFSWQDLWQRPDQQAQRELEAGHASQAQALAQSPALRGSAAYKAGDFATAAQDFGRADSADAQYNLGNSLAKQGHYPQAIAAYDAALKLAPDMQDAAANKQAVEAWLKKQQPQQQDKKQQNPQDSKDHQGHDQDQDDGSGTSSGDKPQDQQNQDGKGQQKDQQQDSGNEAQKDKDGRQGSGQNESSSDQGKQDQDKQDSAEGRQNQSGDEKKSQAQPAANEADQQSQQQFQQAMDQAVKKDAGKDGQQAQPVRLGARETDAPHDEHQQAVEQWMQRIPDDPGGLLRRKFQLEYQRRQNGQGAQGGGG